MFKTIKRGGYKVNVGLTVAGHLSFTKHGKSRQLNTPEFAFFLRDLRLALTKYLDVSTQWSIEVQEPDAVTLCIADRQWDYDITETLFKEVCKYTYSYLGESSRYASEVRYTIGTGLTFEGACRVINIK